MIDLHGQLMHQTQIVPTCLFVFYRVILFDLFQLLFDSVKFSTVFMHPIDIL